MTAVLLPNGKQQFFTAPGVPAVGYKLATFAAGTSAPQATWVDAGQIGANTNPIILDARGEAVIFWNGAYKVQLQDSTGAVIWTVDNVQAQQPNTPTGSQIPSVDNSFSLGSAAFSWANVFVGPNHAPVLDTVSGNLGYYARTQLEINAAVIPPKLGYQPYDVRRYGAVGDGATDDAAAFNLAGTIATPIFVPDPVTSWLLNSDVTGTFQSFGYPKFSGAGLITIRDLSTSDADNIADVCAALEANTATRIATFGDSTMWGAIAGPLTQAATPPFAQMQGAINNYFGNTALTVVNYSISGTTLKQMLKGTDGSGLTFAARIAAEAAPIIFCNHGQNDAAGGGILQTDAKTYRANLVAFIRTVRLAGKTPVLVTPHPSFTFGTFGSQFRAETVSRFAQIMRDVAAMHGVRLVDWFKLLALKMGTLNTVNQANVNLPLSILPDGVHGVQATYTFTGNQLCDAILGDHVDTFRVPGQRINAVRGNTLATGQAFGTSTSSTTSGEVVTGASGAQTMRTLFRTEVPGLDISMMIPIYSSGSQFISANLDGVQAGALASYQAFVAGFTPGTSFLNDVETTLIHNIDAGFHQLTFSTVGPNVIALNGLRCRTAERPIMLGNTAVDMAQRQLLVKKLQIAAGATNNVIVMTDQVVSRFCENLELEWTGQMAKNSGVCVCAYSGPPAGSPGTERLLTFGLNASGFATLSEATGPNAYTATAFDAVDHSLGSHLYRIIASAVNPGTVQMFVDDVSVGTIALAQCYYGGWLGAWKNLNTDNFGVTDVCRVWHF